MCKLRKLAVSCIFILLAIGLFLTCDDPSNPFSNNLGEKVVVEPPTINIDSPVSGAYLSSSEFRKDPVTGEPIFDTVVIKGRAHAYIKVEKVEVYVFADEENGQREIKWTEKGIRLSGSLKDKTWTYDFEPAKFNGGNDGPIRMKFRVWDTKASVESVELIYIIKNRPSQIKMSSPSNTDIENPAKVSDIPWGSDIRGTVIDRRGLRPGYPQIKLWPSNLALPAGKDEPEDDDPNWGYASLFLTTYDDMQKEGNGVEAGPGTYADRTKMRVVNAASFNLRLAEYTIVQDPDNPDLRKVQYKVENGKHVLFGPGTVFNFKIKSMDTSADPLNKMFPTDEGPFITGYFPPMGFGTSNEDAFLYRADSSGKGQPAKIHVYNADSRPTVVIDNTDIGQNILEARPNIYITEPSSRKIEIPTTTQNANPSLFRLRLRAGFTEGGKIYGATLSWLHEATGRGGPLPLSVIKIDSTPVSFNPDPSKSSLFVGDVEEAYFTFIANAAMTTPDGKKIFTSSPDPYTLIFTVKVVDSDDPAIKDPEYRYVVYMDGDNPNVSIRSVRGAATDPAGAAVSANGGLINKDYYTVNGNIQVSVERTDDSGIMAHKEDTNDTMGQKPLEAGYPMVKWIIETVDPASPNTPSTTGNTVLADLVKYKNEPSAQNLKFFYDIGERQQPSDSVTSGWVRRPIPGAELASDRTNHFKLNTSINPAWQWAPNTLTPNDPDSGGPFLWLYVIAQDQVQNLGFVVQKIKVDQNTDKPVMNVRPLSDKNAKDIAITGADGLDVSVGTSGAAYVMDGNWKNGTRNNILARNQGIDLNFTDDDGIALNDIKITLTVVAPVSDVSGSKTVTITAADVLKAGGKRDRSGVLTQKIMAESLYGKASNESLLRDGIYKIEFEVTDDKNEKVDIPASYRTPGSSLTGDTPPTAAKASAVYYFAVSTEMPKVTVKYPDDNAWGSDQPIIISGEVKSRLDIRSLWITFTPNVAEANDGARNPASMPISVTPITPVPPGTPAATAAPDEEGYYNYTWEYKGKNGNGVVFHPGGTSVGGVYFSVDDYPTRDFTVEAFDRIGNMGVTKRTVQIDGKGPDISISDFNYGRPPEVVGTVTAKYVYGKVSFTVSASDSNGLYEADGKSGIKWWVLKDGDPVPSWNTPTTTVYNRAALPNNPTPPALPAGSPTTWTGAGNFPLDPTNGGRYTWVIDTRYLQNGSTYRLYIVALDKAGNPSNTALNSSYEEFIVDWKRDYPTIDENSLDPLTNTVKPKNTTISGIVSDIDLFNPANKNTYVSIRFPKAASGKPTATDGSDWDEWIPIRISDTYSASSGGIDPSGAIVYKFKASDYTTTPVGNTSTPAARAYTYLSNDGVKYYQIKVSDEPVGPTTAGAKWYGKNPDNLFAQNTVSYPGYQFVNHGSVSIVFPEDTPVLVTNPNMNPKDSYSFIVDDTLPDIFFDSWDPTPPISVHPNYSEARPTFSNVNLLIAALKGHVQEYKLSDLSIEYSGKVNNVTKTFRKLIINNRAEPPTFATDPADGKYIWNLSDGITKLDISSTTSADYLFKEIFDAAEQGMQIITFEATDMVPLTRRVSYIFAKDTQGPEINFNNISRAITRANTNPTFTGLTPAWPSDWRYGGTAWQAWPSPGWKDIIENWPSEYAFKTTAAVIASLDAENKRDPSTVIGDPQENYGKTGYSAPVIEGTFNDLYSSVRITVPANTPTYFYYRFKNKSGTALTIPNGKTVTPQPPVSGNWMRKEIEKSPVDAQGKPTQNEKEANWKIELNDADGFTGTDGENWVDIWVKDTADNISDIYNVRFLLDRTAPVLGKHPNDPVDPSDSTKGLKTDADEFVIKSYAKYASGWTVQTLNEARPEQERVFSADGSTNNPPADGVAFTITGTVSDYNFSGMTITIGQEGFGYTVTSSAVINPTLAGAGGTTGQVGSSTDNDGATTSRLRISSGDNNSGYGGAPEWTWEFDVRHKDVAGLRAAAKSGNTDASDSARRYVRVTASDKANKRVGPVDWFFYLDTKKPTLEYTNLNTGIETKATSFENNTLALTGLVEDDTRIKDVQFMIGRWSYATPNQWQWWSGNAWGAAPPDRASWPSAFTSTTVPTRQTSMNWSINQAVLTAANTAKPGTFPDNLFDNEGYYRIDLYITDFSLGDGNPHYTYLATEPTLPKPFEDSNYASTGMRSGRVFYIDKKDPTLRWGWFNTVNGQEVADPDDTYNTSNKTYFRNDKGQAKFSFTVGDGNTIKEWNVEVKDNSTGTIVLNQKITNETKKDWKAGSVIGAAGPIPTPADKNGVVLDNVAINDQKLLLAPFMTKDGLIDNTPTGTDSLDMALARETTWDGSLPTYTVTINVKDGAGRTASISKQFTLDNTPPVFVQDKFSPSSYKYGTPLAPPTATGTPLREYTYDAVTGKFNIRGNTTDNSNQIKAISYYVVNNASGSIATGDFLTPAQITAANKWRYSGGTGDNAPIIPGSGNTTLIEIDQGTFAWRIMVPSTSDFFTDTTAARYMQKTKTGAAGLPGISGPAGASTTPGLYIDVDSISETTVTPVSRTVPLLTFPDLNNPFYSANPKAIYGNEDVGVITVYVRAEDLAGNVAYDVLKYWIWPEGDRPIVTQINNPNSDPAAKKEDRYMNGTIRLSGMAKDNERVKYVWFRVLNAAGVPYTNLQIPRWNEETWEAVTTGELYQKPAVSDDSMTINGTTFTRTGYNGYLGSRRTDDPKMPPATTESIGGGWYMANGGNSREVSWWAYINSNGELDPQGTEESREFTVQVRAQDVKYNDKEDKWVEYTSTYRGLTSTALTVTAWVVANAPTFENPRIAPTDSVTAETAEAGGPTATKYWDLIDNISIRKRSSYKVTVKHNLGISAIRWSPTLWYKDKANNNDIGSFRANPNMDSFNLLNVKPTAYPTYEPGMYLYLNPTGDGYLVGTQTTAFAALTSGASGMALRVVGKTLVTGSTSVYAVYDIFVDINADNLLDKMKADDPDYGNGSTARAGQVQGSVRYPVYLSASEVSKATPLSTRGDALLPIDNLAPSGMYTLNRKPAGTAVTIGGEAEDLGPVNGIARVVLWFQKDGDGISWHQTKPGTNTAAGEVPEATLPQGTFADYSANSGPSWWDAITYGSGTGNVIPTMNGTVAVHKPAISQSTDPTQCANGTGASAIVIDTNSPSVGVAKWGHKLPMGFADGGIGKLWYVEINSYGIPSGPVDLHYVIIDKAGNAKYYKERLIIMNNVAVIDRIKLATDIRQAGSITGNFSSLAGAKINDKDLALTPAQWPQLDKIRNLVPLGGSASDIKDDVKKGISDWVYSNAMGVNKIIDFNVRNNLFGLRLETTKGPVGKNRTFRLEYISGATLYSDTDTGNRKLTNMTAGKVYMINNPGTARWGAIGADGDGPWQRGYTFIAAVNGREDNQDKIIGTGSVWEITTAPAPHQLSAVTPTPDANATSAEFLYGTSAFSANNGPIVDYTRPSDAVPDAVFPPTPNAAYNDWTTWTNANQSLFMLRVFDGAETDYFGDFTIIRVRVNNDDRTKPFAQLYDINPKTEGQERQNIAPNNNEVRRSVSPMFIGEGTNSNRTKGGLWNDSPTLGAVEKLGHIEPRAITYTPAPYNTQQHSLSSAQMGGAETSPGTITKPFANPAGFFTADMVSGKVVLRGYAEDDQRIQRIALKFGTGAEIPILQFQANSNNSGTPGYGTAGNTDSSSANYSPPLTGLLSIPTAQAGNVYFTDSIDAYRHRVEWAYIWDTESVPSSTTVVGSVEVLVTAYNRDRGTTNGKTASDTVNASVRRAHSDNTEANRPNTSPYNPGFPEGLYEYNQITFNLRPYITGFLRNQTNFSHNTRSRQGRYMFYRGETAVVKGFNLGTGSISINNGNGINTANVANANTGNYGITTPNNNHYQQFTVPDATVTGSGLVRYTNGGQNAVNTGTGAANTDGANRKITAATTAAPIRPIRPSYIQPWNIEYSAGVDGSTLWDDFTQVHIWQSNDTNANADRGYFPKGNNLEVFDPAMSVDPATGTLWSSHNEGGGGGNGSAFNTGSTKVGSNDGYGSSVSASFIDPIINSDIYVSPRASGYNNLAYTVWTTYSIIGRSGSTGSWKDYGGVYVSGPQGANPGLSSGQGLVGTTNNGFADGARNARSQYLVESTGYNAGTNTNVDVNWPPGNVDFNAPSRNQFKNPHIVTWYGRGTLNSDTDSNEHIHVSYYDTKDGSLKYRYNRRSQPGVMATTSDIGQTGNTTTLNNSLARNIVPYAWTNLDGGVDDDDAHAFNENNSGWTVSNNSSANLLGTYGNNGGFYTAPWNNFTGALAKNARVKGNVTGTVTVNGNTFTSTLTTTDRTAKDAGEYNSIAVTNQGYPVIAYYDKTNQKLKLAISAATVPIAASHWTIVDNVIPTTNSSAYGTGWYVSMQIDARNASNVVHIAAMNAASKNLVYVRGTLTYNGTTPTYTTNNVQVVDSVGSVGRWCNLSLDSAGNPWIGYQDESYQGSRDGIKLAYYSPNTFYKGVNNNNANDYRPGEDKDLYTTAIGGWEAMHVPTAFRVENARVGMECYPVLNPQFTGTAATKFWGGAVGYLGEDYFRAAYYVK